MVSEKRLIYSDAGKFALEYMENHLVVGESEFLKGYLAGVKALAEGLDKLPAVDAVEVVRCKDCKHWDNREGIFWCQLNSKFYPGGLDWNSFSENDYCSYGERNDNKEDMMFYILERLPRPEILAQLAEEANELGHAALKMRRAIDGRNPTPVTLEEAQEMLEEETADVMLCFLLLGIDWNDPAFGNRVAHKMTRWIERLQKAERKGENAE